MELVETSGALASEKSWAHVVDSTVPHVGPLQKPNRPKSAATPLPQRAKPTGQKPASIPVTAKYFMVFRISFPVFKVSLY